MANQTEVRELSAHEAEAASGGMMREIIIGLFVNHVSDVLKDGGVVGKALDEMNKQGKGKLKPLPPT